MLGKVWFLNMLFSLFEKSLLFGCCIGLFDTALFYGSLVVFCAKALA